MWPIVDEAAQNIVNEIPAVPPVLSGVHNHNASRGTIVMNPEVPEFLPQAYVSANNIETRAPETHENTEATEMADLPGSFSSPVAPILTPTYIETHHDGNGLYTYHYYYY